jgi:hypothetical protein
LARQNYQFEKRQRDLAKKKKQEEKRLRKQQRSQPQPSEPAAPESPPAPPSGDEDDPAHALRELAPLQRRLDRFLHREGLGAVFAHESRKSRTIPIWSACIRVGACPTPATSTTFAFGPHAAIRSQVSRASRSDCAPRSTSVGQRTDS